MHFAWQFISNIFLNDCYVNSLRVLSEGMTAWVNQGQILFYTGYCMPTIWLLCLLFSSYFQEYLVDPEQCFRKGLCWLCQTGTFNPHFMLLESPGHLFMEELVIRMNLIIIRKVHLCFSVVMNRFKQHYILYSFVRFDYQENSQMALFD